MQLRMRPLPAPMELERKYEAEDTARMNETVGNILAKADEEGVTLCLSPNGEGFTYASGNYPSPTLRAMCHTYRDALVTALGGDGEAERRRALTPPPPPPRVFRGRHTQHI